MLRVQPPGEVRARDRGRAERDADTMRAQAGRRVVGRGVHGPPERQAGEPAQHFCVRVRGRGGLERMMSWTGRGRATLTKPRRSFQSPKVLPVPSAFASVVACSFTSETGRDSEINLRLYV